MDLTMTDSVKPNCLSATAGFGHEMVSIALHWWNEAFTERTNQRLLEFAGARRFVHGGLKPLDSPLHQAS